MPELSQRSKQMPASPIRRLVPYADAAKKRGVNIFHLNIGQPDIETPPVFWDQLKNLKQNVLSYSPSNGFAFYREKFAAYYQSLALPLSPENFMITAGGSEALLFTLLAVMDHGDEVIIPEPMYANYIGFAHMGGIRVKPLITH
ncbi:MAG: aminotransferase class I/II-fold pyridoxal phosphate-dependent enzyme, partial [Chitinophagales bacterium]|nr:aminotransferase class I/II-fold pyridoxal phosphate-dependent enzyme [Chitinophagales bacterium]